VQKNKKNNSNERKAIYTKNELSSYDVMYSFNTVFHGIRATVDL